LDEIAGRDAAAVGDQSGDVARRRDARELPEVAVEVWLVAVAAVECDLAQRRAAFAWTISQRPR